MSIVALKRNSRRYKARISGKGNKGFSLNGGHRNQGWVGQGVRGRSITGTPFRGAVPMGNGGCCGTYVQQINNRSSNCCGNDPTIIKRSTMNTLGHIDSTVIYPTSVFNNSCNDGKCPAIQNWVKDFSPLNHSEGQRIFKVARENGKCVNLKDDAGLDTCHKGCKSASYHIGGKKYVREMYSKNLNMLAVGSEEYQRTAMMSKLNLPTPACKKPYPMVLNHNGNCQINFMTSDDAIKRGMLPRDWMNCAKCLNPGMSYITHLDSQNIPTQTPLNDYTKSQRKKLDGQVQNTDKNTKDDVIIDIPQTPTTEPEPEPEFVIPIFYGTFGGTEVIDNNYNHSSNAEEWGGFANVDSSIYPLIFTNEGMISFKYVNTTDTDVSIYFRFEKNPFPDTEPSFNTNSILLENHSEGEVKLIIESQGVNEFNSVILYIENKDVYIKLYDFKIYSDPIPQPDPSTKLMDGIHLLSSPDLAQNGIKTEYELDTYTNVQNNTQNIIIVYRGEDKILPYDSNNNYYSDNFITVQVTSYDTSQDKYSGVITINDGQSIITSNFTTSKLPVPTSGVMSVTHSISHDYSELTLAEVQAKGWTIWGDQQGSPDDGSLTVQLANNETFRFNAIDYSTVYIGSNGAISFNSSDVGGWYSTTSSILQNIVGITIPWIDLNSSIGTQPAGKYIAYKQENNTFKIKYNTSQFNIENVIEVTVILHLDSHHRDGDIDIHYNKAEFLDPKDNVPNGVTHFGLSYGSNIHSTNDIIPHITELKTNGVGHFKTLQNGILFEEIDIDNTNGNSTPVLVDLSDILFRYTFP